MRAAVIGTNWGRVHVAALREAGVDVVALVGDQPDEVRAVAAELGVDRALTDVAGLAALGPDLVCVATPAATHAQIIEALPDVPVICEKPAVGLSPARELPPVRRSPVWVNHAFAFLEVVGRAEAALDLIGPITQARATTTFDLPGKPGNGRDMFMELASHPWSWLVHVLGRPRPGGPEVPVAGGVDLPVACGRTPVSLRCTHVAGFGGIGHHVVITGERGCLEVVGTFEIGNPWRFEARIVVPAASGAPQPIGPPEQGLPDPWYRANARSIGAVVQVLRGGPAHPALVDWDAALRLDAVAQAGFGTASPAHATSTWTWSRCRFTGLSGSDPPKR